MKKLLTILFVLLLAIPVTINAEEKLKVYLFEAGDCPYCEAEKEYLKTVKGYGETFEVISKELYIDHVDWEPGKDYDLGVKVASEFHSLGFDDATYEATPFVVISDLYAAAGYNTNLDDIIDYAIGEGDKDAVSCIEEGKEECIRKVTSAFSSATKKDNKNVKYSKTSIGTTVVVVSAIVAVLILGKKKGK